MSGRKRREQRMETSQARATLFPVLRRRWVLAVILVSAAVVLGLRVAARFLPKGEPRFVFAPIPQEVKTSDPFRLEALELAEQITRDLPDDPNALFARGLILYRVGLYAQAVESWRACLQLNPRHAMAYYCIGQYAFEEGDFDKTIEAMQQAIAADPEVEDAPLFIGKALLSKGEMEKAIEMLKRQVAQSPRSTEGYYRLGQAYSESGRAKDAVDCYSAALEINPKCQNAYFGLSEAYRQLGQDEEAREYQRKFQSIAVEWDGRTRGMRRGYDDQATMRESLSHFHDVAAKAYAAAGDRSKADECFHRAAELDRPKGRGRDKR